AGWVSRRLDLPAADSTRRWVVVPSAPADQALRRSHPEGVRRQSSNDFNGLPASVAKMPATKPTSSAATAAWRIDGSAALFIASGNRKPDAHGIKASLNSSKPASVNEMRHQPPKGQP